MKNFLIVNLESCGNPDYGQYAPLSPQLGKVVKSIEVAQLAVNKYIQEYGLGGGNLAGGQVIDAVTRKEIGYISYNGRFWTMEEREQFA